METDWRARPVAPTLVLRAAGAMPSLPPALERRVEAHWQAALRSNPKLFNGTLFGIDRMEDGLLLGHWSEFRRLAAQIAEPGLREAVGLRPLAVCGLLEGPDGAVIGRRHAGAVYQPGLWQFPPAGSIDRDTAGTGGGAVDWRRQFDAELFEELGLAATDLRDPRPFCLIEHPPSGITDLCVHARTDRTGAEILAAHAACGDWEYDRIAVVPRERVEAFVAERREALAPQTRALLRAAAGIGRD